MKNRIPPPIYLIVTGVLMWLLSKSQYDPSISIPFATALSRVGYMTGAAIAILAAWQFRRAGTTIDPLRPGKASNLVSGGVFQFSRNPMYLGMVLILIGLEIKLGSAFGLVPLVLFVVLITYLQIKPEEKALKELFGEPYEAYCRRVRRWV